MPTSTSVLRPKVVSIDASVTRVPSEGLSCELKEKQKEQVLCEYKSPAHEVILSLLDLLGPTFKYTASIL